MLLLLPPSETKRDGGEEGSVLDLSALSFPGLTPLRRSVGASLAKLSRNLKTMGEALKLGTSQHHELLRNRAFRSSPTMPAMDRYTGVLFDGFATRSLTPEARTFAVEHVVVHSALFGLVGAGDRIPAYRLSHDSRLPGLSLKATWSKPVSKLLAEYDGLIVDLRSESYVALGPAPKREGSYYVRVVAEGADGRKRALNHFNKKGKGEFVRALVGARVDHSSADSLLEWAAGQGIGLSRGSDGELELLVANTLTPPPDTPASDAVSDSLVFQ